MDEIESAKVSEGNTSPRPSPQSGEGELKVVPFPADGICEDPGMLGDQWRIEEANRRLQLVEAFKKLKADGLSSSAAAKLIGKSLTSLWRYETAFDKDGFNGLVPATDKCGRKSKAEELGLSKELIAQIKGLNSDTLSTTAALRLFAHSDKCPEDLANYILNPHMSSKHAIARSIRSAVRLNDAERNAHRGPRRLSLRGIWTPRKLDILPGDIFSSDDTTPIWAWWVPWVECEDYPFGKKVLQGQLLPVMDVASQCIVTFALIAREKSSYRAVDIWNLFGHTFDTVGLPRLGWQLERGSWEANIIAGQEVEYQDGEVTMARRVGGLRQLPTNITDWHRAKLGEAADCFPKTLQTWTSFLPKSKSIEGWFSRNQTFEGTLWGSLGRDQMRAPFEKAKKQFEICARNKADPGNHFLSQTEICARVRQLVEYVNNEPMEGEVFHGIPIQKYQQAVTERPLFNPEPEKQYLWRRNWKALTITQGWARVRLTDPAHKRYSLFYTNPSVFPRLEGQEVFAYYDRENFEQPAQIHLARTGEFICEAQFEERKGSFLDGDLSGHEVRKQWRNAVMSAYATIVKHAPSRQLPPEIAARREQSKQDTSPRPSPQSGEGEGSRRPEIIVDGVMPRRAPAAPAARTPAEIEKQRKDLEREAELANRLRALQQNPC